MHLDLVSIAGTTGLLAGAVYLVSSVALVFAYRRHYLRKFGVACPLPLFRFSRTHETLSDAIRRLEFRDPMDWGLRSWLILYYLAQLVVVVSLIVFAAGMFAPASA